jgi:hypothetical protein
MISHSRNGSRQEPAYRSFSGNASDAPPEEPEVEQRFVASLDDAGEIRLPASRSDLRIAGADKANGHERTFVPDTDYRDFIHRGGVAEPLHFRVFRKADGTGFFILRRDGTPILPGQYRIMLEYRRDNQSADPNSTVFQQAGRREPEQVTIDIPTISRSVDPGS